MDGGEEDVWGRADGGRDEGWEGRGEWEWGVECVGGAVFCGLLGVQWRWRVLSGRVAQGKE